MNCVEVGIGIESLFDGAIDPARKREMESHLTECASCSAHLEQMRAVRALLRKTAVPPPSPSLDARVMRTFREHHAPERVTSAWWRRLLFGAVRVPNPALAMSLAAVCVALYVGIRVGRMSGTQIVMTPAPSLSSIAIAPPSPSPVNVEPATPQRIVPQPVATSRNESRPAAPRKVSGVVPARTATTKPLESFTVVSPSGANYSTMAALAGFEPVTGAKARVIKGEEER